MSTQHRALSSEVPHIQTDGINQLRNVLSSAPEHKRAQTNSTQRAVTELILQLNTISLHKQGIKLNKGKQRMLLIKAYKNSGK